MTKLLLRFFVPNSEASGDPAVRARYGALVGGVGIACNSVLFLAKLIIGLLSGSVAIMADAVNNLADAASSLMTLFGFRLSAKPADAEHPFGHARYEYVTGFAVAGLILVIGVQTFEGAIGKIFAPEMVPMTAALLVVLLLSIALKVWLCLFQRSIAKRLGSTALRATSEDSRNDAITTTGLLLSLIVSHYVRIDLDGYLGVLIAIFILYSAVQLGKETLRPLLGTAPDATLVSMIRDKTLSFHPSILGVHDLVVHDYGPGRCFASLHAELDYRLDVLEAHEIIDAVERMFQQEHQIPLVIHYDPIVTDDPELALLRDFVKQSLLRIDRRMDAHDFRLVRGEAKSNLIFDVVMPYEMGKREVEIAVELSERVKQVNPGYEIVISFDYEGISPEM